MIDRAARRRRALGGKRAAGRPSLSSMGYAALKAMLVIRAEGRCEYLRVAEPLDPEHAVPRSAGGSDAWQNVWMSSRRAHRMKEAAFDQGRLLVEPLGDGRFHFRLVRARDKFAYARGEYELLGERVGGRAATEEELEMLEGLR